jgi:UDP-glucuronate 4-epimerase
MKSKIFFITGVAGFIGFSFSRLLLKKGHKVIGIDNMDNYYSVSLKKKRLKNLKKYKNFKFRLLDIENYESFKYFNKNKIDHIFHFAAQAGVRYSVINPNKYIKTNILGTINVLNFSRQIRPKSIFFASSSSVYGDSKKFPLNENDELNPKNIYASSKVVNEISAESYSKDYNLKIYGLRFFTIYGEWGRPDMLLFKIIKNSIKKTFLKLNNNGNHYRDFTYINDVTNIMYSLSQKNIKKKFDVFNICSNNPQFIKNIVSYFKKSIFNLRIKNISKNSLDVFKTHGDNTKIINLTKFKNFTDFKIAFKNTYDWYLKNL